MEVFSILLDFLASLPNFLLNFDLEVASFSKFLLNDDQDVYIETLYFLGIVDLLRRRILTKMTCIQVITISLYY